MAKKSSTKNKSALIGTNSADVLTVKHTQVTVNAGKGNDKININSGSSHKIYGEAGNDTIIVAAKAGSGSKFYGDDAKGKLTGKDTFTINGGKKNYFYGGKGVDTFKINGGSTNYFYGEAGNDVITVGTKAGSGSKIYGDDAKGKLTGNDKFTISGGKKNYFYGGKGVDTFNVNGGATNYIYGGVGNDVIVIGKTSTGTAIVKDFSAKSGNKDTVKVTGGTVKSIGVSGTNNMIVKGGKSAAVTLQNAKSKTFTVTDTLGTYAVSGANVKLALGKNYKGTLNAASFITTVDARNDANAITITGNAKNNIIYGGAGNNTLNGGAGNDTLTGGAGKDVFKYANGQGKDTITDYAAGQDTLQITSGSIGKTALANSNKDLVFTVGSGSITLKNAAAKAISLKDSRGSYTVTDTAITLGSDFTGMMDATKYLSTVKSIDASAATKTANITGNAQDNVITVGKAGGTYKGGAGNDTIHVNSSGKNTVYGDAGDDIINISGGNNIIYGGAGKDTVNYTSGTTTLKDFTAEDSLTLADKLTELKIDGTNVVLTAGTDNVITAENATGKLTQVTEDGQVKELYSINEGTNSNNQIQTTIRIGKAFEDRDLVVNTSFTTDLTQIEFEGLANLSKGINLTVTALATKTKVFGTNYVDSYGYGDTIKILGEGDSSVYGKAGNDWLYGGAGVDVLYGGEGDDQIEGGLGDDTLYGEVGDDTLKGGGGRDYLYGGDGIDRLEGGDGIDRLEGGDGNDWLYGDAGNDWLYGGNGNDWIEGGDGDDYMKGEAGNDELRGGFGKDELWGGAGNDTLYGGAGVDVLYGEAGEDWLYGEAGDDFLYASDDKDHLYGGDGNDKLFGQDGDDELFGGAGDDKLYGGDGDDTLYGGAGADELYAGAGDGCLYANDQSKNDDGCRDTFFFDKDCIGTYYIFDFKTGTGTTSDLIKLNGIGVKSCYAYDYDSSKYGELELTNNAIIHIAGDMKNKTILVEGATIAPEHGDNSGIIRFT